MLMEVTQDLLPWSTGDVIAWNNFLNTHTGKRLIPKLLEFVPELCDSGDTNKVLIRSGELRGWQAAARQLLYLTNEQKEIVQSTDSNYPPLDRDDAWSDGEKLN